MPEPAEPRVRIHSAPPTSHCEPIPVLASFRAKSETDSPGIDRSPREATEGAVAKITGSKSHHITGPARVFECEEDCLNSILAEKIKAGDVLVIRYEGPKGGPGMREMLSPTSAIIGAGLGDAVGLITAVSRAAPTGWWSAMPHPRRKWVD